MMMGSSQQQQQSQQSALQQSYPPYMMQPGGMKSGGMPAQSQQYYGNTSMGRHAMGQSNLTGQAQRMANQMPKPVQDYSGFQQQQMQHRYPQVEYTVLACFLRHPLLFYCGYIINTHFNNT